MADIFLRDRHGNVLLKLSPEMFPLVMNVDTITTTNKAYKLKLSYFRDPQSKLKDKHKVTGAFLTNAVEEED